MRRYHIRILKLWDIWIIWRLKKVYKLYPFQSCLILRHSNCRIAYWVFFSRTVHQLLLIQFRYLYIQDFDLIVTEIEIYIQNPNEILWRINPERFLFFFFKSVCFISITKIRKVIELRNFSYRKVIKLQIFIFSWRFLKLNRLPFFIKKISVYFENNFYLS